MLEYKWFKAGETDSSYENIRKEVFVDEQGYDLADEFDDCDNSCPHLVIFSDGEAVSTGRVTQVDALTCKIGRIAVRKCMRGTGLGEKTVSQLLHFSKSAGYKTVLVSAQSYAVGFYEKCGFALTDAPEYLDGHIPHRDMIKTL